MKENKMVTNTGADLDIDILYKKILDESNLELLSTIGTDLDIDITYKKMLG